MPAGMKIRIFPRSEMAVQGQMCLATFELTGTTSGVRFTLGKAQFLERDRHFAEEWDLASPAQGRRAR